MAQTYPAAPYRGQVSILNPQAQRDALQKFIISADLPLNISGHLSYLKFLKVFYPNYRGSRVTTRRDVLAYYSRHREA